MKTNKKKSPPATLYRYRPLGDSELFERELNAICGSYLYAPSFEQMNDPMEALFDFCISNDPMASCLPPELISMSNEILNQSFKTARSSGLISMSETYLDYPLWAYYGSNFAGMCLEFDTQDLRTSDLPADALEPRPVIYTPKPPTPVTLKTLAFSNPMDIIFNRLIQKRKEWQHEKEWRYFAGKTGRKLYLDSALKRIYLGPRIKEETKSAIVNAMRERPVEILEGSVRGYDVKFSCIKDSMPWKKCERIGAGNFKSIESLILNKELRNFLGEKYNILEKRCDEISTHPNFESIKSVYLLDKSAGVCVAVSYRLRDKRCISKNHFFDISINPLKYPYPHS